MGVVRDVTIDQLTQAVQGISSAGMTDTTGQDIKDAIDALDMTAGTLGKDSSLQDIKTAINNLGSAISPSANNVTFDNTGTGMTASNAQAAIVELNTNKQNNVVGGAVSTIDFNDYKTQGNYWVNATGSSNAPTTGYCFLEVVQTSNTNCLQRVTKYATSGANMGMTWVRWFGNNQWYSWTLTAGQIWEYDTITMGTMTVNQNNRGVFTKNVAKSGYTPVGIVEIQLSNNWMYIGSYMISSNTAQVVIHNINTTDSQTVTIKVLYKLS